MQPGNQGQDPYGEQQPGGQQPPQGQPPQGQPPQYGQPPYSSDPYSQQPSSGPPGQPYPSAPSYPAGSYGAPPSQPSNTMGLVAMILGIVSIPLVCCFGIGIASGIASAVLGFLGMRKADQGQATNKGQAMTGLICGAVAAVGGIILLIISAVADWDTTV